MHVFIKINFQYNNYYIYVTLHGHAQKETHQPGGCMHGWGASGCYTEGGGVRELANQNLHVSCVETGVDRVAVGLCAV